MRWAIAAFGWLVCQSNWALALVGDAGPADIVIERYTVMVASEKGRCSGVVLASDLILTAAHCVEADGIRYIIAGYYTGHGRGASYRAGDVASVNRHPEYSKGKDFSNAKDSKADLALLKLAKPLPSHYTATFLEPRSIVAGDRVI